MKHFLKILLIFLLFLDFSLASDKMFILPQQSKPALKEILKQLSLAKKSVKITIYNFTHKKIANRLKTISKKGIKVKIIYDNESIKRKQGKTTYYYLAKYKNIDVYSIRGKYVKKKNYFGKMHQKIALIDDKVLILGSANWSYSGFGKNYEVVIICENPEFAKKYSKFFDNLLKRAKKF